MNKNLRTIIGIFLVCVIIFMSVLIWKNKDTYFRQEINVTYFDGCVETFINGKLVSDECTASREMAEKIKNERNNIMKNQLQNFSYEFKHDN